MRARSQRRTIYVVGPLPPPMHGAARVTEAIAALAEQQGVTVHRLNTGVAQERSLYHVVRAARHFRIASTLLLSGRRPATTYLCGAGGYGLWYQVCVVAAARLSGHQIVFHHHSYSYINKTSVAMRALQRAGGRSLLHVFLAREMETQFCERYLWRGPRLICHNAGVLGASSPVDCAPRDSSLPLTLGHLGNLSIAKGLATVLETFRELRTGGWDVRLELAGPPAGPAEADLIANASIDFRGFFHWRGKIENRMVPQYMREIDLLLLPSTYRHEAQPLVALEAARSGAATVAYHVGCLASVVFDPAFLVALEDSFADRVIAITGNLAADGVARAHLRSQVLSHYADLEAHGRRQQAELVETMAWTRSGNARSESTE